MTEPVKQTTSQGERKRARALAAEEDLPYAEALRRIRTTAAPETEAEARTALLDQAVTLAATCVICALNALFDARSTRCDVEWRAGGPGEDEQYLDGAAVVLAVCAECNPHVTNYGDAIAARRGRPVPWQVCPTHGDAGRGPVALPRNLPATGGAHLAMQRRYQWTDLTTKGIDKRRNRLAREAAEAEFAELYEERAAEEAFWGDTPVRCRSCPEWSTGPGCCVED